VSPPQSKRVTTLLLTLDADEATQQKPSLGEETLAFFCNWVVTAPICVLAGAFAFMIGNAILSVNNTGYLPAHISAAEGALGGLILSPLVTIFSMIDYYILRDTTDDRGWHFRGWLLPTSRQLIACHGLSLGAGVIGHAILSNGDLVRAIKASGLGMSIYTCGIYAVYFVCTILLAVV